MREAHAMTWAPRIERTVMAACCDMVVGVDANGTRWQVVRVVEGWFGPTGRRHECPVER
jgi:hypothetical protein